MWIRIEASTCTLIRHCLRVVCSCRCSLRYQRLDDLRNCTTCSSWILFRRVSGVQNRKQSELLILTKPISIIWRTHGHKTAHNRVATHNSSKNMAHRGNADRHTSGFGKRSSASVPMSTFLHGSADSSTTTTAQPESILWLSLAFQPT